MPPSLAGVRIGISRFFFYEGLDPEVAAITELTLDVLRANGAELVFVDIPEEIPDLYPTFPDPVSKKKKKKRKIYIFPCKIICLLKTIPLPCNPLSPLPQ